MVVMTNLCSHFQDGVSHDDDYHGCWLVNWSFYLRSHFQDDPSHNGDDHIRDVGDRHYSEVQRHSGGRVSTKVIHVKVMDNRNTIHR